MGEMIYRAFIVLLFAFQHKKLQTFEEKDF